MDDSAIVDLYLARDETAVSHTAEKYGRKLRRIAENITADAPTAEECENDAYLEAWNRIPPHEPRTYLFAFLGRIVRHLAVDAVRRSAAGKRSALFCELTKEMEECLPGEGGVEERADAAALLRVIDAFLARRTEEQRTMFVRRYWYCDTISEISRRCRCTPGKVKTALFRMRESLREELEKEGYRI